MDASSDSSVLNGMDADPCTSPYAMLASQCEAIECSSVMIMGTHNRCSFEVTIKVNNKLFIASGPTILSAKKKASNAALQDIRNEGYNITKKTSSKALDFGKTTAESADIVCLGSSFDNDPHTSEWTSYKTNQPQVGTNLSTTTNYSAAEVNSVIGSSCSSETESIGEMCVLENRNQNLNDHHVVEENNMSTLIDPQSLANVETASNQFPADYISLLAKSDRPPLKIVNVVEDYTPIQNALEQILSPIPRLSELQTNNENKDADVQENTAISIKSKEMIKAAKNIDNGKGDNSSDIFAEGNPQGIENQTAAVLDECSNSRYDTAEDLSFIIKSVEQEEGIDTCNGRDVLSSSLNKKDISSDIEEDTEKSTKAMNSVEHSKASNSNTEKEADSKKKNCNTKTTPITTISAVEVLEEYINYCALMESNKKMGKSDSNKENTDPVSIIEEVCHESSLKVNIPTKVVQLKAPDLNMQEKHSNLGIGQVYDNTPQSCLENVQPIAEDKSPETIIPTKILSIAEDKSPKTIIPTKILSDLKLNEHLTIIKTEPENISELDMIVDSGFQENSTNINDESTGVQISNDSTFAEINTNSELYQINESIILPISDIANIKEKPRINEKTSVPNPFAKKLKKVNNIAKKVMANNKIQENTNINIIKKVNKKINSTNTNGAVKVQIKENKNQFIKKNQNIITADIRTLKNKTIKIEEIQNERTVVEGDTTQSTIACKASTSKVLAMKKQKPLEKNSNSASKKIKPVTVSTQQQDENTDSSEENTNSTTSESSIELISPSLKMDTNKEKTINHCLALLLNDSEENFDLEKILLTDKTVPAVKKMNSKSKGKKLNTIVNIAKKGKGQTKVLSRNAIQINDDVLEVPLTPNSNPQKLQLPIALQINKTSTPKSEFKKPKTPAKKLTTKIKIISPNSKTRYHPYRQRYLEELAAKRKINRKSKKDNEIADPIKRLNTICPDIKYQLESEMGPSHAPFVILSAVWNGRNFYGHGKTRQSARLDAAKQILDTIDQNFIGNQDEQPSTSNSGFKNPEPETFDAVLNNVPLNSQMDKQTETNNDIHSNFTNNDNFEGYVSPLPPRNQRVANVLPNNHQFNDQSSNNSSGNVFSQSRRMNFENGNNSNFAGGSSHRRVYYTGNGNRSFNTQNNFSRYNNRQNTSNDFGNFNNTGGRFCPLVLGYLLDNLTNTRSTNHHQYSGQFRTNQQRFNNNNRHYANQWRERQRANHYDLCRFPRNAGPNNIPRQLSFNQRHHDDDDVPQTSRPEPPICINPSNFPKSLLLSQRDSDVIEQLVLDRFEQLTHSRPEVVNYKVLAGIVMTRHSNFDNAKVIAIATGTKCINGGNISSEGTVINDSHAEIIARRCLMKFLYTQLKYHTNPNNTNESIFLRNPVGVKYAFTLKPQVQFHLYISSAPCGDARIFSHNRDDHLPMNDRSHGQLRTKVEGGMGTIRIGNQYLQQAWDGIQIGDPLHTMSCSDKIARWNVLGVQGALLNTLTEPIYLSSIVLGSMFNTRHLYRAICGRLEQSLNFLPQPFRLNRPLLGQTSTTRTLRRTDVIPKIGFNWTFGDNDVEVISLPAGREISNKMSSLCKNMFFQKFVTLVRSIPNLDVSQMPQIYGEVKLIAGDFQIAKQVLFDAFQHSELGCWVKKPEEQNEFTVYC